jgi:hypothetical protein
MLTIFTPGGPVPGPVTAILTGDEESKAAYVREYPIRRACRDSNYFSDDDPDSDGAWSWYALKWSTYIDWDGDGPMPLRDRLRLVTLAERARAKGRRLRFWKIPEREAVWRQALDAGVDLIGADDIRRLRAFLGGP